MSIILPYYLHDDDDDDSESKHSDEWSDPHDEVSYVKSNLAKKTPGILDVHEKTNISPTYIGVDQERIGNCGMWASSNILLNFINYSIFYYNKYNRKQKHYLQLPSEIIDKIKFIFTSTFILNIVENEINNKNGYNLLNETIRDIRDIDHSKYQIIIHIFIIYFFSIIVIDDIVRFKVNNDTFTLYNKEKYNRELLHRATLSNTMDLSCIPTFYDRGVNIDDYLYFFNMLYLQHKLPSELIENVKEILRKKKKDNNLKYIPSEFISYLDKLFTDLNTSSHLSGIPMYIEKVRYDWHLKKGEKVISRYNTQQLLTTLKKILELGIYIKIAVNITEKSKLKVMFPDPSSYECRSCDHAMVIKQYSNRNLYVENSYGESYKIIKLTDEEFKYECRIDTFLSFFFIYPIIHNISSRLFNYFNYLRIGGRTRKNKLRKMKYKLNRSIK